MQKTTTFSAQLSTQSLPMQKSITLSAPSRLHFGLFSVGQQVDLEFGGIGLMVDSPRTSIRVSQASELIVNGPERDVCWQAIERWISNLKPEIALGTLGDVSLKSVAQLPLEIRIESLPPRHCGLGTGTQLALCTIAALTQYFGLPLAGPVELASAVGRGNRSAIGSYGFFHGGFLVDRGKSATETIAPLDFQTDFPEPWPVLIVRKLNASGVFGRDERLAFERLPPTSSTQRQIMVELVRDHILPGILNRDYQRFGDAIYRFGRNSGLFFQTVQGGPYNGTMVQDLVASIREFGIPAVGQTSWGPSVFAIAADQDKASFVREKIIQRYGDQYETIVTRADNQGFRLIQSNDKSVVSRDSTV